MRTEEPGERVYEEATEDVVGCVGGSIRTEEPGDRVMRRPLRMYEESVKEV